MDRATYNATYRQAAEHGRPGITVTLGHDTAQLLTHLPVALHDEAPAIAELLRRHNSVTARILPDPDGMIVQLAAGILRDVADMYAALPIDAVLRAMENETDRILSRTGEPFARIHVGTDPNYGTPDTVRVPAMLACQGIGTAFAILDALLADGFDTLADALTAEPCYCGAPTVAALTCPDHAPPADTCPGITLGGAR
jgi:hypothetical protein